ncbi:uncharacterized protein [Physcomitrium patens]|uniref:GATA-type domain-containing protein n=1 Tax=Physcomitrium patens TaxID=3218 RepID=A0A2K1IN46_PHYPA|nr:uncharacterized protein LOC112274736 [Physcomitrium patens]PNR30688.1 hypothetical protein PHYPA_027004 [Physcomitrium patens]|eukprot:XP_024360216.1 uncharacterized protein LOC112274736 [Physcomitrella patens]
MLQESLGNFELHGSLQPIWVRECSAHADVREDALLDLNSIPNLLKPPSLTAAVGLTKAAASFTGGGSCDSESSSVGMDESICGDPSLAVDCTLSLGSSATQRMDIPARLSRAGSPAQDLVWSLSARSEPADALTRHTCEQDVSEQGVSWDVSSSRSDPDATPEYQPQMAVSDRTASGEDTVHRSGSKTWAKPCVPTNDRDEVNTSKGHLSMIDGSAYDSRPGRQSWLPNFLSSTGLASEVKATSRFERCMQPEGINFVRVCAHCGTSKTPLWRNGPQGPKSLCNACGIRFKKAGRRSAANGSSELQDTPLTSVTAVKVENPKAVDADVDHQQCWECSPEVKPRKRSRGSFLHQRASESSLSGGSCMTWQSCLLTSSPKNVDSRASPIVGSREKKLVFRKAFSTDEEEGAELLMALSCGMVYT